MSPSFAGKVMTSTPGGGVTREPSVVINRRRTPSSANSFALAPRRPLRIDHGTRRLRTSDLSHRQLRVVSQRRSDADHDNIDQRT